MKNEIGNTRQMHEPSLRELTAEFDGFRDVMNERDRRYDERFTASKEAVAKAEAATEKRFDAVNEFRKTLADQAAGFLPRQEYLANHQALIDKLETSKETTVRELNTLRENISKEISDLRESRSQLQGKSSGFNAAWGIAASIALLALTLLAVLVPWLLRTH